MSDKREKIKTIYSSAIPGCTWQVYPERIGFLVDDYTENIICGYREVCSGNDDSTPRCIRFQLVSRRAVYQCEMLELAALMDMLEDLVLNDSGTADPAPQNGVVITDVTEICEKKTKEMEVEQNDPRRNEHQAL